MSRCDFAGMIILPAKITLTQFNQALNICDQYCFAWDYTTIHTIKRCEDYRLRYTARYFFGGPKKM
jgi:hypothetical protein